MDRGSSNRDRRTVDPPPHSTVGSFFGGDRWKFFPIFLLNLFQGSGVVGKRGRDGKGGSVGSSLSLDPAPFVRPKHWTPNREKRVLRSSLT